MKDCYKDVLEFSQVMGSMIGTRPQIRTLAKRQVRMDMLLEEVQEYVEANVAGDLTEIFDALLDIIYIAVGTGIAHGLPMIEGWAEVQRTNMAKAPNGIVLKRADGKIIKPEGWQGPKLRELIMKEFKRYEVGIEEAGAWREQTATDENRVDG